MHPDLSADDVGYVAEAVIEAIGTTASAGRPDVEVDDRDQRRGKRTRG